MKNEIFIRVDKPEYVGGETIYGTVFLRVLVPFAARSLFLELKGYEKVFWEYEETEWYDEDGQRKSRTIVREHKAENSFFKDNFTLISYPGGFPIGEWSYPFQYTLPNNLPGVFKKKKDRGLKYKAKICYKLKATVDVVFAKDLMYKTHLVINEKLDKNIQPKHQRKEITVMTMCCIPRGKASCEMWMDKNCYMSGETSKLHVSVSNQSAVDVNHFNSKLIRTITLRTQSGHTHTLRDVVSMRKYDGTPSGSNKQSDIPLPLLGKKEKPLKPSTTSKLVKCEYQMMVELDIPWAPDLEIYTPVTIYSPQSHQWINWQPPQWISTAVYQPVLPQIAVPQEILDVRIQGGMFVPPPNFEIVIGPNSTTTTHSSMHASSSNGIVMQADFNNNYNYQTTMGGDVKVDFKVNFNSNERTPLLS